MTSSSAAVVCPAYQQDNDHDGVCAPSCSNLLCVHGVCDDSSGQVVCTCDFGWAGDSCLNCSPERQDRDGNGTCELNCTEALRIGALSCDTGYVCRDVTGYPECVCDPLVPANSGPCRDREWLNSPMPPIQPTNYTTTAGTVMDNITGLMWERNHVPDDYLRKPFSYAIAYCENLVIEGYSDWRLPTRIELYTIVDLSRMAPTINTTVFPNTQIYLFITSSVMFQTVDRWLVDFYDGRSRTGTGVSAVRCVREI